MAQLNPSRLLFFQTTKKFGLVFECTSSTEKVEATKTNHSREIGFKIHDQPCTQSFSLRPMERCRFDASGGYLCPSSYSFCAISDPVPL